MGISGKLKLLLSFSIIGLFTHCNLLDSEDNNSKNAVTEEENAEDIEDSNVASGGNFLFLADIHLNAIDVDTPTSYGVDTHMDLWNQAKAKIREVIKDESPNFIVYTGDLPDHKQTDKTAHNKNMRTVLEDLVSLAQGIPLFYAPGNNDAINGDYYPFSLCNGRNAFDLDPTDKYPAPFASVIYDYDSIHGYYSAKAMEGLRIIALNSVLLGRTYHSNHCHTSNMPAETRLEAGTAEITWLKNQLAKAKAAGEKAYIIMHIPPGTDVWEKEQMWALTKWKDDFLNHVEAYKNTITGILYGHTHMEEIRLMASSSGGYSEVAISSPGISPNHKNNPGFKIVSYNKDTELTGFTTYYTKLPVTKWGNLTYSTQKVYSCGTNTLFDCLTQMDRSSLENQMKDYYTVEHDTTDHNISKGIYVNHSEK